VRVNNNIMQLRVLGCSGGIGKGRRTTAFLLDDDILIDAGSGVGDLTLEEMAAIRHIFLSHSHLDHTHAIPLLVDSVFDWIREPVQVHALPETLEALQAHIFNGIIWPDFTRLPEPERPVLRFVPMRPGEMVQLGERAVEMIPVNHIVPTVGYRVSSPTATFAFSGDTTTNDHFWEVLNAGERLDLLVVEAAFSNAEEALCRIARHYCPRLLSADLCKLRHHPRIFLTHAKPGEEEQILEECRDSLGDLDVDHLSGGEIFTL